MEEELKPLKATAEVRSFGDWRFVAVGGAILRTFRSVETTVASWRESYQRNPKSAIYELELGFNHEHPTTDFNREALRFNREALRKAREMGQELADALTHCYPEIPFLLVYREEQLSFCQAAPGVWEELQAQPQEKWDARVRKVSAESFWCEHCQHNIMAELRSSPDAEFPLTQFAECTVCGREVLVFCEEEVVRIEPSLSLIE